MSLFQNIEVSKKFENVKNVSPEELNEHKDKITIVDVRNPDEYHEGPLGHIENALLVPLPVLPQKMEEILKNDIVVFVCRSGNRSGQAALMAQEHSPSEVYNLTGGMLLWNEKNLDVIKP